MVVKALGARLRYIAFNMAATRSSKHVCEVEASLNWQEKRSDVREKSQLKERSLDRHSSALIITTFCYCLSLSFRGQKKGHRRPIQLELNAADRGHHSHSRRIVGSIIHSG